MSERSQKALVWWGVGFAAIYGGAFLFLLHMVPPPSPNLSSTEVAAFYDRHHDAIRIGAIIASWTSAFMVPLSIVVGLQLARQEGTSRVWSLTAIVGGSLMSIFLVLPPLFWGVAAYTPGRASPEVTQLMHELGCLTLTTTDQYYVFLWVAMIVVSFLPAAAAHSPFPRWYGYLNAWIGLMFEAGALAFLPQTGPFSWRGLLVFWSPLTLFAVWITVTATLLLKALNRQIADSALVPAGATA